MTVSDQIISVIDSLAEKVGLVVDWSGQNIMPYLQDLIRRISYMEICNNIILIIVAIICSLAALKLVKCCKKMCDDDDECCELACLVIFGIVLLSITGLICALIGICGLPEAICLPEVTAYKYMLEAIK